MFCRLVPIMIMYEEVYNPRLHAPSTSILFIHQSSLSTMEVPPGPAYLLRLLPYIIFPPVVVYAFIDLAKILFKVAASPWLIVITTTLVNPALFIANRYYRRFRNERAAACNGAVPPPPVQESLLSIIGKLTKSMTSGYPGE